MRGEEERNMFDRCEEVVECAQNVHDEEGLKAADATDIVVSRMKGESRHYM